MSSSLYEKRVPSAFQTWREQVAACCREREEEDHQLWQRLGGWYDAWVQHNDYVDQVLPRLLRHLSSTARVLEVGPGSGGFTLQLAPAVQEIVAVEPAPRMQDVLTCNLAEAGITNARLVPRRVEEALEEMEGAFDLALASHSLYNVASIETVLRGLVRLARYVVILIGTGEQRVWYQDLHRRFKGKERVASPHFGCLYPVLLAMGIYADVEVVWTSANYVYDSEQALVDWWLGHFHLDETYRAALGAELLQVARWRGDQVGIYDRRRTALVWIDRERSLFETNDSRL
jgi:ubiquinone/menaquinone biosynthesis C-methylase UbiE